MIVRRTSFTYCSDARNWNPRNFRDSFSSRVITLLIPRGSFLLDELIVAYCVLWSAEVHYSLLKSQPLVPPIHSQKHPIHNFMYFLVCFNIILASTRIFQADPFVLVFGPKLCFHFNLYFAYYMPHLYYSFSPDHRNNILWQVQVMEFLGFAHLIRKENRNVNLSEHRTKFGCVAWNNSKNQYCSFYGFSQPFIVLKLSHYVSGVGCTAFFR
jgi:hypothetical protein